jgi:hypothetical protein
MIRIHQVNRLEYVKDSKSGIFSDKKHIEKYLVTTVYFLFIPIWSFKKLLTSNL